MSPECRVRLAAPRMLVPRIKAWVRGHFWAWLIFAPLYPGNSHISLARLLWDSMTLFL